jgi:16S rRNA (guanine527-N7)-methyltransferase
MKALQIEPMKMLIDGINQLSVNLQTRQIEQLTGLIQLLIKWNKAYNLTAITEDLRIVSHHILDSLSILSSIEGTQIIDVGSGAGFPGLPCAIALPDSHFTLLDSNGKKIRFITHAINELSIKNVTVVQARVEQYKPQHCFDTVIARAFSSIDKFLAVSKHLVCPQGQFLLMKGQYPKAELQSIGIHAKVTKLFVPYVQEDRHLVCIKGLANE